MTKPIITIHCDMDGVVVDMDRFIREHLSAAAQGNDAIMWPELQGMPNFYRKMKPTPYAAKLWKAVQATGLPRVMLTAIPRVTTIPEAEVDKNWWVDYYQHRVFNGERPAVNIGPYSKDKWRHCKFGDILIDDRADNCAAWKDAGGFPILHTGDVEATITRLNFLVQHITG